MAATCGCCNEPSGYQRAAAAALLSTTWGAKEARQVGLVLDVTGPDLVQRAIALASGMDGLEQDFAARMVASFRASAAITRHDEALALETDAQEWSTSLPGFAAGVETIRRRVAGS